ncbi:hypothetical protein PIIN_11814 [Serendipita indica DSM 11827]|uniref:Uncharacterized protein n=1 Tax=Serendipita indica (strain DSM 11827) TaxID=1109443 RepID=G4U018_SERID|nr:hypothetical protein PIIN_11814 [Serendipita indica DSM 11827]
MSAGFNVGTLPHYATPHPPAHPPRSNSMSEAGQYQAPCHTYDYSPRSPLSHYPNYYPPPGEPHPSLTNARSQSYNGSPQTPINTILHLRIILPITVNPPSPSPTVSRKCT